MKRIFASISFAATAAAFAASVERAPLNSLDLDANPQVVTNVTFEGIAESSNVYTKAETDQRIVALAPAPDFSTNNTALVETIEATAPAPGDYANVSNKAVNAASRYKSLLDCEWLCDGSHLLTKKTATEGVVAEWRHSHRPLLGGESLFYYGDGVWTFAPGSSGLLYVATNAEDSAVLVFDEYVLVRTNDVRAAVVYSDDLAAATNELAASSAQGFSLATNYTDEAIAALDIPDPDAIATNLVETVISNSLFNLTYDETLQVTWRKTAEGGAFYERCYTNINMTGVQP